MRLLVLGGTAWLGGTVAAEAVARGHEVVCLARGSSGRVPDGARLVVADRDDATALDAVTDGAWDAVVDVARQPGHVRRAAAALEPVTGRFLLVSTVNVYEDGASVESAEDGPLRAPLAADTMTALEEYGSAKV